MHKARWASISAAALLFACGNKAPEVAAPAHVVRTTGSAVALSRDERIAVVSNRSAGVVTVFTLDPTRGAGEAMVTGKVVLDVGAGSEPWAAVVGADDDTAYVLLRERQTVMKITSLHDAPAMEAQVNVGSEPTAIAISGSGKQLFVANFAEGTVSVIRTKTFGTPEARDPTVDLNYSLANTGVLGEVAARPALAHPRALALTDDGDDSDEDEALYATEFFSQPVLGADQLSDIDRNRQGFVYRISLQNASTTAISIAPVQQTGFFDGEGKATACLPNQLSAAAIDNGRLYVTSMCASPRGPLGPLDANMMPTDRNFKTLVHPAVFVIDIASNRELPAKGRLLTQRLASYYDAGEADTDARMPLSPNAIAFVGSATGSTAYVSALGADAVFRLEYDLEGELVDIGSPGSRSIRLENKVNTLPVGVAISTGAALPFLLVANDATQSLWLVDRIAEHVDSAKAAPDTPRAIAVLDSEENKGHKLFATGRDVWSFKGQAWSSCESCHPDGGSDGVTWFFARGPRRTLSTANTYDKAAKLSDRKRRMLLWGANIDEVHDVEAIVRSVSGGAGAVLWLYGGIPDAQCRLVYDGMSPTSSGAGPCGAQKATSFLESGLNGSLSALVDPGMFCAEDGACNRIGSSDWDRIDSYIRSIRAPRAPTKVDPAAIAAGRALFEVGKCAGCHGGPGWTISKLFYEPGREQNGALPFERPAGGSLDLGKLRKQFYLVPKPLLRLNPPALQQTMPTFRTAPAVDEADQVGFVYPTARQANEQIQCALRDVGTFPAPPSATGIVAAGAPSVFEYRQDMKSPAQGKDGFNVPSLFGLAQGAPYFHAGNARVLEEVFDEAFTAHFRALSPDLLTNAITRSDEISKLVAFLLSIDESTTIVSAPTDVDSDGSPFDYDLCRR